MTDRAKSAFVPIVLTTLAMIAFAANSLLTRLALAPNPILIDAASFANIRVTSAALTLWIIVLWRTRTKIPARADPKMAIALFVYMVGFSFAYILLETGTGALILFGSVQLTMFGYAIYRGERFSPLSWVGLAAALAGMVLLVSPAGAAPEPVGVILMVGAGIGWGAYSLMGRTASSPLFSTAWNFAYCLPLVMIVSVVFWTSAHFTTNGVILALTSGVIASGLGYVIWYAALNYLSAGRAASVQLSAPVIAAIAGVMILSEPLSLQMVLACLITLGGVGLAISQRRDR